jgi:hypothetical protein
MALAPTMMPSDGKTPLFGRQRTRRALIVVLALVCLLLFLLPVLSDALPGWLVPTSILLVAALLVTNMLLRFTTHSLAIAPDAAIDERQSAVRNRAYRLSHKVLAVAFGIPLWLLFLHAGSGRSSLLAYAAENFGLIVAYLELLFFTPTVIIAWNEPDAVVDEEDGAFRVPARGYVVLGLTVLVVLSPLLLSATVAVSEQGSTETRPLPGYGASLCRYVRANEHVGWGISANVRMDGAYCWNGNRVWREWGLGTGGCNALSSSIGTDTAVRCTAAYRRDHALDVRYQVVVRPVPLPAAGRLITFHLLVGPDGHVRQLTRSVTAAPAERAPTAYHVWHGLGSAGPYTFAMPTGLVPLVTSRPWHLTYRYACHGLRHPPGLPPRFQLNQVFGLILTGENGARSGGAASSDSLDRDSRSLSLPDGGSYELSITTRPTCRWTVEAR